MIPLHDDIKTRRFPVVTYSLIAFNVLIYLYQIGLGVDLESFLFTYGLVPWNMTKGIASEGFSVKGHVLPWISYMFLHGGVVHLLSNMWFLHVFGDNVEDRLGRVRFIVLYFCGGLIAALMQVMTGPSEMVPMVGASGAVSAILAAYALYYPRVRVLALVFIFLVPIPAFLFIGFWFVVQLFNGYTSLLWESGTGVAWWAHIGGFAAGLVLAKALGFGCDDPCMKEMRTGLRVIGR